MLFRIILFLSLPITACGILHSLGITSFWTYFYSVVFCVGFQYAIDFALRQFFITKYALKIKQVNLELEKEYNKRGFELTCPCVEKDKCFVPIDLQEGAIYDCPKCDKKISVYVKLGTALNTEPIVAQSLDALPLNLKDE